MIAKLRAHFEKLKNDLKPMSFSEKVDHIWTYYKEVMLVGGVALTFVIGIISVTITNLTEDVVFHGLLCNITTTQEGSNYLTDNFEEKLPLKKGDYVTIGGCEYDDVEDYNGVQNIYNQTMGVVAQVNAKELDYMFLDEKSLEFFVPEAFYMDLRELFTEEQLAQIDPAAFRYAQPEGVDEMFPIAIKVTDMPFVQDCLYVGEEVFLVFIANTRRIESCRLFWEHLLAWESPKTEK